MFVFCLLLQSPKLTVRSWKDVIPNRKGSSSNHQFAPGPGSSGSISKTSLLAEHVTGGRVGEVSDVPRVDLRDVPMRI